MLPIHLAIILRRLWTGDIADFPTPDEVVPTRVIVRVLLAFLAVVALVCLWAAL